MTARPARMLPLFAALFAAMLVIGALPAHAIDPTRLADSKLEARYTTLLHELRCPVCQDENLADSPADAASEMRAQIRRMLTEGKTDAQIKQYFVSRYSEFILFKPQYSLRNAWLWLLPFVLLAIGIIVAVRVIRARATLVDQNAGDVDDELAEPQPHADGAPSANRAAARESGSARPGGPAREGAAH
ncbi:MAG: cytochrome c-type biogenesis protein [Steroidobacteraceae bacterium]